MPLERSQSPQDARLNQPRLIMTPSYLTQIAHAIPGASQATPAIGSAVSVARLKRLRLNLRNNLWIKYETLSAAIRYGSKLKPQARGSICIMTSSGLGTCALGAAWDAVCTARGESPLGADEIESFTNTAVEALSEAGIDCFEAFINNPVTGIHQSLTSAIVDLNDKQGWTREAIADWLAEQGL